MNKILLMTLVFAANCLCAGGDWFSFVASKRAVGGGFSATGGTVADYGAYRSHTFTNSSSFVVTGSGSVDILLVGAGGQAGMGGGGGGGVTTVVAYAVSSGSYTVTVGTCAWGDVAPNAGGATYFGSLTVAGGGRGGFDNASYYNGGNGASGGGAGNAWGGGTFYGGTNIYGAIGCAGGGVNMPTGRRPGGGGGGAGHDGYSPADSTHAGNGGDGTTNDFRYGTNVWYGGGGGAGFIQGNWNQTGGSGGKGGGSGGWNDYYFNHGPSGSANTGGGGGGNRSDGSGMGGEGGSGIVVIRYTL